MTISVPFSGFGQFFVLFSQSLLAAKAALRERNVLYGYSRFSIAISSRTSLKTTSGIYDKEFTIN